MLVPTPAGGRLSKSLVIIKHNYSRRYELCSLPQQFLVDVVHVVELPQDLLQLPLPLGRDVRPRVEERPRRGTHLLQREVVPHLDVGAIRQFISEGRF